MPRVAYENWNPGASALEVIREANSICAEYAAQGYDLTLRQLYYQFVARGLIANNAREYNRLGNIVNKARLAGYMDWNYIVDRTRNLESMPHWDDPADIINGAAENYGIDKWATQPVRVEVWVEKEALAGVVERSAASRDCAWFSCRGYVSQSEMWAAARRFYKYIKGGQCVEILHLGDHDPSGIDMTRDIEARLRTFLSQDWLNAHASEFTGERVAVRDIFAHMTGATGAVPIRVNRIALNYDQVEEYQPPPNPAKITDSRAESYIQDYGYESWELDALPPDVLDGLIQEAIDNVVDQDAYYEKVEQEEEERAQLQRVSDRWEDVAELVAEE